VATTPNIKITKVAQMQGHKDAIYDFALDKEKGIVYSAGADGYIVAWDLKNPETGNLVLQTNEALYSIAQYRDVLLAGSKSGTIYQIDLNASALVSRNKVHQGGVFFITPTHSGGEDGMLRNHLETTLLEEVNGLKLSDYSLRCFVSNNTYWFIGCSDNRIYKLNKETLVVDAILEGHTNSVFGVELIDDYTLVSTGRDAHIRAWDLKLNKEVYSVPAHNYQAKSLSFNGTFLLSSSMDKTIKVWSEELKLLKVIDLERYDGHTNCINKVQWVDENMFVSSSDDRSLVLWKLDLLP
jgi:WD40 repeat protein